MTSMITWLCITAFGCHEVRTQSPPSCLQGGVACAATGAGEHILEVDEAGWGRRATLAAGLKAAVEGPHEQRTASDHETNDAEVVLRCCITGNCRIRVPCVCTCGGICRRDRGGGAQDALLLWRRQSRESLCMSAYQCTW